MTVKSSELTTFKGRDPVDFFFYIVTAAVNHARLFSARHTRKKTRGKSKQWKRRRDAITKKVNEPKRAPRKEYF